jgi:cell fate regulator YaaT (PSP1 superfamily)
MPEVVGVRFKRAGKIYYFDPSGIELHARDWVIVETSRGKEAGWVVVSPVQVEEGELDEPLKPVVRRAQTSELKRMDRFRAREREAIATCTERIVQLNLPMKLVGCEYCFDGSRLTFFFTSEARVDFRELVRDLAATFRARVELRQVGVRDEARLIDGVGPCGRHLCCAAFLTDFANVSIKMAKDQDLPLNPLKISGMCGRLMCCLSYEHDDYCQTKARMPHLNEKVETPNGVGRVTAINVIKESVVVVSEEGTIIELPVSELVRFSDAPQMPSPARKKRRRKKKTQSCESPALHDDGDSLACGAMEP